MEDSAPRVIGALLDLLLLLSAVLLLSYLTEVVRNSLTVRNAHRELTVLTLVLPGPRTCVMQDISVSQEHPTLKLPVVP